VDDMLVTGMPWPSAAHNWNVLYAHLPQVLQALYCHGHVQLRGLESRCLMTFTVLHTRNGEHTSHSMHTQNCRALVVACKHTRYMRNLRPVMALAHDNTSFFDSNEHNSLHVSQAARRGDV
jgi:hypothetical protein